MSLAHQLLNYSNVNWYVVNFLVNQLNCHMYLIQIFMCKLNNQVSNFNAYFFTALHTCITKLSFSCDDKKNSNFTIGLINDWQYLLQIGGLCRSILFFHQNVIQKFENIGQIYIVNCVKFYCYIHWYLIYHQQQI